MPPRQRGIRPVERPWQNGVRAVGVESDGPATLCLDGREHRSGVDSPVPTIHLRNRGIARIRDPQIRQRAAPEAASSRAVAAAMPLFAPVISATWFCKSNGAGIMVAVATVNRPLGLLRSSTVA